MKRLRLFVEYWLGCKQRLVKGPESDTRYNHLRGRVFDCERRLSLLEEKKHDRED